MVGKISRSNVFTHCDSCNRYSMRYSGCAVGFAEDEMAKARFPAMSETIEDSERRMALLALSS